MAQAFFSVGFIHIEFPAPLAVTLPGPLTDVPRAPTPLHELVPMPTAVTFSHKYRSTLLYYLLGMSDKSAVHKFEPSAAHVNQ